MAKREPALPALGQFLSKLQETKLVNGKHLTNAFIASQAMISTKTYNLLKKG